VERVYYHGLTADAVCMWVTVQYVLSLSHRLFAICIMSFTLCCSNYLYYFLSIRFMFVLSFCMFCFLFCAHCVCVLFLPMYTVVYFLFVYNFTDHCHRLETQMQLRKLISYYFIQNPVKYDLTRSLIADLIFMEPCIVVWLVAITNEMQL